MKVVRIEVSDEEMAKERIAVGDIVVVDSTARITENDLVAVQSEGQFLIRRASIIEETNILGKVMEVRIRF